MSGEADVDGADTAAGPPRPVALHHSDGVKAQALKLVNRFQTAIIIVDDPFAHRSRSPVCPVWVPPATLTTEMYRFNIQVLHRLGQHM